MALPYQDFPDLERKDYTELASSLILKAARALFKENAVKELEWEKPKLTGLVEEAGEVYAPELNLRSLVFTENRCSCETGRRGLVCRHALALCLEIERQREKAIQQAIEETETKPTKPQSPNPQPETPNTKHVTRNTQHSPSSLKRDDRGKPLGLWLLLPPNLEQAVKRNSIPLKLEFQAEEKRVAPEKLFKGQAYAFSDALAGVLAQLEIMGGGQIYSLFQMQPPLLAVMLEALAGEAAVAWVNQPQKPIPWEGTSLAGVTDHLAPPKTSTATESPKQTPAAPPQKPRRKKRVQFEESSSSKARIEVDGSEHFLCFYFSQPSHKASFDWMEILKQEGFRKEPSNGKFWLRDRHRTLNFLAQYWEDLQKEPTVRFSKNFQQRSRHLKPASFSLETEPQEKGAFEVSMDLQAGNTTSADLQRALVSNQRFIQDGDSVWLLSPEKIEEAATLQQKLTGQPERVLTTQFKTRLQAPLLPVATEFIEEFDPDFQPRETWQERSSALRQTENLEPIPVYGNLDTTLRPYQKLGASWLWHLYLNNLGGILADEMGLGKTLQAIALIEAVHHSSNNKQETKNQETALVVCPASLVENWRREVFRFAPKLSVYVHHGSNRLEEAEAIHTHDLVITSYGTLTRDQEILLSRTWSLILADEAQHVKNRRTQASKALRSLSSSGRFILTGTPIENAVDDLRSLFSFLMPGYLTAIPVDSKREDKQWYDERHLQQTAPYILRRTKALVAPELPEKIEQVVYCEMPKAQKELYQKVREDTQKQIFEMEMSGASEGKIKFAALTQLLRLRQVCADPRVLEPEFNPKHSAKLIAFREILDEALDGNHRILVFSQFTQVLKLLKETTDAANLSSCYLDGSTRNRQDLVDQFNADDSIPLFYISLRAGGVGLNLTGADTVIHFDPWWNPAVEDQATDRAHRIGQTRVVTSLKFIAAKSVEEKVLEIQQTKAALLKDLFEVSDASSTRVNLQDIKDLLEAE